MSTFRKRRTTRNPKRRTSRRPLRPNVENSSMLANGTSAAFRVGDTLVLERWPVYGRRQPSAHRTSRKTIASIEWESEDVAWVELEGVTHRFAGGSTLRLFRMARSRDGAWWLTDGPPNPLRYLVVEELMPNKKARALGRRAAMRTNFGDTLDDEELDTLGGARGRDVDAAMKRYQTFHAKAPIRVAELAHELPDRWVCVGDALAVMYRTDKWKKDGTDEDYKHLHDAGDDKPYAVRKGVRFYEPAKAVRGGRAQRLPVAKPKALTLLGYCLGAFVRKDDDGETYETNPRGCYLFSSPSGNALYLYSPHKQSDGSSGFLAAMAGGKLRVLKDGIDG